MWDGLSFLEHEAIRISAIVCARYVTSDCGGSLGQQASGQFAGLELATEGAFATRGRAQECQAPLGKFRD